MGLFDKKKAVNEDSIYSSVISKEQVNELLESEELKAVYLMPLIFNGQQSEKNTVYVPSFVFEIKEKSDIMIEELLMKNIINNYVCKPTYIGESLVPSKLDITAKKNGNIVFTQSINIW